MKKTLLQLGFIAIIVWGIVSWQTRNMLSGVEAPTFQLVTLDGGIYDFSHAEGSSTLLYFFAPWCSICHYSASNLQALRDSTNEKDLTILYVALGYENKQQVEAFIDQHQLTVPVVLGDSRIQQDYRVEAFPSYYFIDKNGFILDKSRGVSTEIGLKIKTYFNFSVATINE